MPIPAEIIALVERLNRDLNEIEQEAVQGLTQARNKLSQFPDNSLLIQLFAYLNNALLFVDISRQQIQSTIDSISLIVSHQTTYHRRQCKKLGKIWQHC